MNTTNIPAGSHRDSNVGLVWEEVLNGAGGLTFEVPMQGTIRVSAGADLAVTIGGVLAATLRSGEVEYFNVGTGVGTEVIPFFQETNSGNKTSGLLRNRPGHPFAFLAERVDRSTPPASTSQWNLDQSQPVVGESTPVGFETLRDPAGHSRPDGENMDSHGAQASARSSADSLLGLQSFSSW